MEPWLEALILRPFFAVAFALVALLVARAVYPLIPAGRVKRVLYDSELRARHPWKFCLGFFALVWGAFALAYFFA